MTLFCYGDLMAEIIVHPLKTPALGDEVSAEFIVHPGGQALNVARVYQHLGGKSALCAAIGKDRWSKVLINELRREGIRLHLQQYALSTGMVLSLVQDQQRTMFTKRGANESLRFSRLKGLRKGDSIYFSGYLLLNPKGTVLAEHVKEVAKRFGLLTAVDTPPAQVLTKIGVSTFIDNFEGVETLFCTEDEAYVLTGNSTVRESAAQLNQRFPLVVIKQGSEGCWVQENGKGNPIPTTPLIDIEPTGAGDAFCSGFLFALAQNQDAVSAGKFAHGVAAKTISRIG